jgi:LPS O-antigen subunit length determinant protein (WzzB/FepE family)
MASPTPGSRVDSFDLVLFLWARRKLIIGVTLLGMVGGVVAAFVIRPLFKSEVILFPAITNSASKALLNEQSTGRDDILALGDAEDAEQLLQVLNSDLVRERTAAHFDLMRAYKIKADSRTRNTDLREAYKDHITFEYTKFGSVRVEVLHHQPDTAALMANFIAAQVDSVWKDMNRERASKGLKLVADKVAELEQEITQIEDSMRVLRQLGVHDYHTQTERYNEYLGAAIVKGDQRAVKEFEERFKVLAQYGGAYVTLQDRQFNEVKRLSVLRMKLEQARADHESDLPHKFIVNQAQVPDKKAYPVRWLVVAISTISAFLLALLLIVVQEQVKKIRAAHA